MTTTMQMPTTLMPANQEYQSCMDALNKCAQICGECYSLCLQQSHLGDRSNCINALMDCSEICMTTASFISRRSKHIKEISNLCADICEKCANECSSFSDQHNQMCADTCRQCASECRSMVNMSK